MTIQDLDELYAELQRAQEQQIADGLAELEQRILERLDRQFRLFALGVEDPCTAEEPPPPCTNRTFVVVVCAFPWGADQGLDAESDRMPALFFGVLLPAQEPEQAVVDLPE